MKKVMNHYATVAVALFVTLTVLFATPALANEEKKNTSVELTHVGSYENQPIFQLKVSAVEADEFTVILRDKEGNVLYNDRIKGTSFSKRFLLSSDELGDSVLTVEVRSKKNAKPEIYTINRKQNIVEETYVTRVK